MVKVTDCAADKYIRGYHLTKWAESDILWATRR
jgi:hypothetical protein